MAMLTVRVSAGTEEELEAIAQSRGSTKSDIAREAIAAYLSGHEFTARGTLPPDGETDDFAEFGDAVRHANRRVLSGLFETLLDTSFRLNGTRSSSQHTNSSRPAWSNSLRIMGCRACRIGVRMWLFFQRRSALLRRMISTWSCDSMNSSTNMARNVDRLRKPDPSILRPTN